MKKFIALSLIFAFFVIAVPAETHPPKSRRAGNPTRNYKYSRFKKRSRSKQIQGSGNPVNTALEAQKPSPVVAAQNYSAPIAPQFAPTPLPSSGGVVIDAKPKILPLKEEQDSKGNIESGNVDVQVMSNFNTTARLGLAPRGMITIEFPVDDPIYSIYTGDDEFVKVFCRASNDKNQCLSDYSAPIVLMPGKQFHNWSSDIDTTTIITVQRRSGITATFYIVPVRSIAQNANHVVVRYSTPEVVAARRSAGLVVNLGIPQVADSFAANGDAKKTGETAAQTVPVANQSQYTSVDFKETVLAAQNSPAVIQNPAAETSSTDSDLSEEEYKNLVGLTVNTLQRVGNSSARINYQKPVHGISLAVVGGSVRLQEIVVDVIAVRNTLSVPFKLVPNANGAFEPLLSVETYANNKAVSSETLKVLHFATTAENTDILQPGEVYYFAVAYKSPILGAKQFLKVSFAQTNASDEPATALLGNYAR